jgi:type IV secretion system protein VirD4
MSALRELYGRAGRRKVKEIVFLLSEFPSLKKLTSVEAARAQGRKYGLRMLFVTQDIHQLRDIYGPHGAESFAGQCDAVFAFAPGEWESAEWMSRRSGEEKFITESASESEDRPGVNRNYTIQQRRAWPPERILDLPDYHGLVWFRGRSKAVPVYAAPYWTIPAAKRLARPDPFHDTSGDDAESLPVLPKRRVRPLAVAALAMLLAGGLIILPHPPVFHFLQSLGLIAAPATPAPAHGKPRLKTEARRHT